ncbi:TIGR03086 family metal-binding protein [Janibacter cremeus]|uniref:TIGR03086 family metal-binding protein n=1 Tax=Janibacter cremeus TaxID=1285192 RepID=UPI0023F6D644|nr:TIGR03086 family metal-binding protein [Janibacter cremeus]WEV76717.1 TIGR03086 family metal-binding protein [Janibacter cremeus]
MTSLTELSVVERYRSAADTFTDRVRGTPDWDAPSPVAQWRARDIVGHLSTWLPALVTSGSQVQFVPVPSAEEDPVAAWEQTDAQVRALLEDPASEQVVFAHERIGELPLPAMLDQYFTSDVVFHTWDLARATGQDDRLDEEFIAGALEGMSARAAMIRASGQFGDQQPVPEGASTQERFLAFIGRDPRWTPPA